MRVNSNRTGTNLSCFASIPACTDLLKAGNTLVTGALRSFGTVRSDLSAFDKNQGDDLLLDLVRPSKGAAVGLVTEQGYAQVISKI